MITTNELRIGNIILDSKGLAIRIESLWNDRVNLCFRETPCGQAMWDAYYTKDLTPIHLDDDWLNYSAFAAEDGVYVNRRAGINIRVKEVEPNYFQIVCKKGHKIGIPFMYVHELQNLYYGLVAEELEINIPETANSEK